MVRSAGPCAGYAGAVTARQGVARRGGGIEGKLAALVALAATLVVIAVSGITCSGLSAASATGISAPADRPLPEGPRQVTFVNHMDQTIWVAASPGNAPAQLRVTGWRLPSGASVTVTVPNRWNGRFWGRTGCHFDAEGRGRCETGDCAGRFMCTGFGSIPATLAEYDLDAWDHLDFYDVSMVDGSNLPMYINQVDGHGKDPISPEGCSAAGCTEAVICPHLLQVMKRGKVVGCISACARLGTDQYCCRGKWSSRDACDPKLWPVDYAAVFKRAEPFAYSYVYDDATSVFTCSGRCSYRITFGLSPPGARPPA
jgi:Thaumatin family